MPRMDNKWRASGQPCKEKPVTKEKKTSRKSSKRNLLNVSTIAVFVDVS